MSPRLRTALALAGSFALGGGLLYVALRGADLEAVGAELRGGAWGWLVPLFAATVLSVVVRAWRWTLLLDTLPRSDGGRQADRTPLSVALASLLIGYLVNLAVPRLGEVVRAGNVAARRPVGFAAVVGTVVAERLLDVGMLALALALVALLFGGRLGAVASEAAEGLDRVSAGLPGAGVALAAALVVAVAVALWVRSRRSTVGGAGRLAAVAGQFRDGALTLVRTGRPTALAGSTVAIWACYAAMSWFPLQILGMTGTYGLGLVDAFALMTVGADVRDGPAEAGQDAPPVDGDGVERLDRGGPEVHAVRERLGPPDGHADGDEGHRGDGRGRARPDVPPGRGWTEPTRRDHGRAARAPGRACGASAAGTVASFAACVAARSPVPCQRSATSPARA
ncbi:MAG TPA: lysylphosphatidylglycerol synthase transmembrane domain-containing protein [Rubricoccaceae bacterium]